MVNFRLLEILQRHAETAGPWFETQNRHVYLTSIVTRASVIAVGAQTGYARVAHNAQRRGLHAADNQPGCEHDPANPQQIPIRPLPPLRPPRNVKRLHRSSCFVLRRTASVEAYPPALHFCGRLTREKWMKLLCPDYTRRITRRGKAARYKRSSKVRSRNPLCKA
jgi:hypothetical protein